MNQLSRSAVLLAIVATPGLATAQGHTGSGDGFLFHEPSWSVVLRGGYDRANASSDVFALQKEQLTIGPRGFDALSLGGDLNYFLTRHIDVGVTVEGSTRTHRSEYREWQGADGLPIEQSTSLNTVGLSGSIRYNLRDRGRSVSNFAWIPTPLVPYVGVGGGVINYEFRQKGEFVDFSTNDIFADDLKSSAWGSMTQVFGGLSYTVNARTSLISEARYTRSTVRMNNDYRDFDRIDLSGLSLNIGTSIRF